SKLKMPAVPTTRSPSYAAMARSASNSAVQFARSSSRGRSPKASSPASKNVRGSPSKGRTSISMDGLWRANRHARCSTMPAMFPISDENERGTGPAYVTLAFIAINVAVFLLLQGALSSADGAEFTYGYAAVPYEITNGVDLVED